MGWIERSSLLVHRLTLTSSLELKSSGLWPGGSKESRGAWAHFITFAGKVAGEGAGEWVRGLNRSIEPRQSPEVVGSTPSICPPALTLNPSFSHGQGMLPFVSINLYYSNSFPLFSFRTGNEKLINYLASDAK